MTIVDPLTAPRLMVYRMAMASGYPCDCDPAALHSDTCPLTPLYATLTDELGNPFLYGLWGTTLSGWGYCNPDNPWCRHKCTLDSRDSRIIDPDCFR